MAYRPIPGDVNITTYIEQAIRVNHAGEFGAKRIYAGQLAVMKDGEAKKEVEHMQEQEQVHLDFFEAELSKRQIRPTLLHPVWNVLGFALGAGTAMLGEKAAMACTIAVEEVIEEHYQEQIDHLGDDEKALRDTIHQFRQDELEHRHTGIEYDGEQAPAYALLSHAIKTGSKLAIWLSKRI